MPILFFILALISGAHASDKETRMSEAWESGETRKDVKHGFVMGIGASKVVYGLYQDFEGTTEQFKEEKIDLYGPTLTIGYDWMVAQRLLVGLRAEPYMLSTFKRNDSKTLNSSTTVDGQVYGMNAIGRLGLLFDFKTKNLFLDEWGSFIGELFVEAGMGRGNSTLGKDYRFSDGVTEELYDIRVNEDFMTRIWAVGFSATTINGAYIELKFAQMSTFNNDVRIQGKGQVNSGTIDDFNIPLKNVSSTPTTFVGLNVGHHW